jgi:hypothetical protein
LLGRDLNRNSVAIHGSDTLASCARGLRYPFVMGDPRRELVAATERYRTTEAAHETARLDAIAAVLTALRADIGPAEVARLSPFTDAYVRKLARDNGVPPAAPGPKRRIDNDG